MGQAATIIQLNDNAKLMKQFSTYLQRKRVHTTKLAYLKEINRFYDWLCGKQVTLLDDGNVVSAITEKEMLMDQSQAHDYQHYLIEEGLSASSINKAIVSVRGLYTQLAANNFPVKSEWFKGLEKVESEGEQWAAFTFEESMKAMEVVRHTEKGDMKAAMINTVIHTGFRIGDLEKLRKEHITLFENKTWTIKVKGKRGKWNWKPITPELKDEILSITDKYNYTDGAIFKIQRNTVNKMMKLIRKELGLERAGEERYVFHSFKKCAVSEIYNITNGDVKHIQEAGNHADASTALNIYTKLEKRKQIHESPMLLIGKDINIMEALGELTREQIVALIGKCGKNVHYELYNLLQSGA